MEDDLALAGDTVVQRPRRWIPRAGRLAAYAPMQADAQRPAACRIVVGWHLYDVVERYPTRLRRQLDASSLLRSVRSARLKLPDHVVERGTARRDLADGSL